MASIHSRALLVNLSISTWSARRYDKAATDKVNRDFNASSDAGRYNKSLLPGNAQSYKTLMSHVSSVRVEHYRRTLAWSEDGKRLLTTAEFSNYSDWFRQAKATFDTLYDAFEVDYPTLKAAAKVALNGLYREDDYPEPEVMREKFSMSVAYDPIPSAGDIRVSLSDVQIADIAAGITDRVQTATKIAVKDAWSRLRDSVSHMAEKLSQPEAIFRDSLVGNVREVCDILKRLNVTDDVDLETMRQTVEAELSTYEPDILRDEPDVRAEAANKAQNILDAMSGLYGAL